MDVVLDRIDAADWVYRGEGAVNLVLGYTGSSPAFVGKLIRLRKVPTNKKPKEMLTQCVNGGSIVGKHDKILWRDNEELVSSSSRDTMERIYVEQIMSPLLGPKYIDAGIRVPVTGEFLEYARKNVTGQRPAWRVDAAEVDVHRDSVLLLSDHTLFPQGILEGEPCIAVEIKPKCGFLPNSRFIAEENAIKRSVTRFKMHQALKLCKREISELSEYDPLDLFSRSKERICKAIKVLCTTPQNNFRVFLNGSLIFGALGGGTCKTSFAVGEAFEDVLKGVIKADNGLRTNSFIQLVAEIVYQAGILDRLLEVQSLDNFDIEGAIHAYYNIVSQPCKACEELDEEKVRLYSSLHSISLDESLKIVKDYLIATTAKDCSLMISFRPKSKDVSGSYNRVYLDSTNQDFDYKKTMVSVELLCLKCMQKVMKLIAKVEGITSIVMDPSKNTVTVIREADPVKIIKKVREYSKSASILSIGPPKEEKKDVIPVTPRTCQRCDVWYVIGEDSYSYCSIL